MQASIYSLELFNEAALDDELKGPISNDTSLMMSAFLIMIVYTSTGVIMPQAWKGATYIVNGGSMPAQPWV